MDEHATAPVHLSLRDERLTLTRENLMNLPESILLCLFPSGIVLNNPPPAQQASSSQESLEEEEEVYVVDVCRSLSLRRPDRPKRPRADGIMKRCLVGLFFQFDAACLEYILKFFDAAKLDFYGTPDHPRRPFVSNDEIFSMGQQPQVPGSPMGNSSLPPNPLFHRQSIILLREELDYFAIPPKKGKDVLDPNYPQTDAEGFPNFALTEIKKHAGQRLLGRKNIFTALQRNVNREKNVAEQHLIDMLCMSYVL